MSSCHHPPVPAFYTNPQSVADIVDHCVARVLDCFGIDVPDMSRWGETCLAPMQKPHRPVPLTVA